LEDGQVYEQTELPALIQTQPSSIVIAHHVGHVIRDLDAALRDNPRWQFRATPIRRELYKPNGKISKTFIRQTVIAYFGFQRSSPRERGHYHYPLSPMLFTDQSVHDIRPGDEPIALKLIEWGKDVRGFCADYGLTVSPTKAGLAGQLLKDSRWYPEDRRKVPQSTNAKVRPKLPGNYYELSADEGRYYKASYLDQSNAHHAAAQSIQFPCANTLRARGRFSSLENKPYTRKPQGYGLFYGQISVPHFPRNVFPPVCMRGRTGTTRLAFFYSNEIADIYAVGGRINYIIASWTSPEAETGLNQYATWAIERLRESDRERRNWLKPTLLATYGLLGAKPKFQEYGYRQAKGNVVLEDYPVGSGFLQVKARKTTKAHEPSIANGIHLGMIQAETRQRSLQLARSLAAVGHKVLAIYADSVFVREGRPLPLLEPPWKIQAHLTGLRFLNPTAFTSRELTKLPGVPLADRERATRRVPVPRSNRMPGKVAIRR
jgi:hypothetical protein